MKKIGVLVFIIMMMAVVTAVQAEVRAGGLPALVVDDRISDGKAPAMAPSRAGGLPAITVDGRIPNCTCKTDPSCYAKPVVAEPAPVPEPEPVVVVPPPLLHLRRLHQLPSLSLLKKADRLLMSNSILINQPLRKVTTKISMIWLK
jgi:hypothetical protein